MNPSDPNPINAVNERGMTELHLAAYHGELEWATNCIEAGFDVNARDRDGYTPLHWVADMSMVDGEREEVALALLRAGTDTTAVNALGETPYQTAIRAEGHYMAKLIGNYAT